MKTILFSLLFLGLTNLMLAQNDLAYVSLNEHKTIPDINNEKVINQDYLETVTDANSSKIILKLQDIVANYDIKSADVYHKNNSTTYTVEFKEGNNKLVVVYDKNGKLLCSTENYQAIKLPFGLSSDLIKENPGWALNQVYCQIQYDNYAEKEITYTVVLKNGKKTKKIKISV